MWNFTCGTFGFGESAFTAPHASTCLVAPPDRNVTLACDWFTCKRTPVALRAISCDACAAGAKASAARTSSFSRCLAMTPHTGSSQTAAWFKPGRSLESALATACKEIGQTGVRRIDRLKRAGEHAEPDIRLRRRERQHRAERRAADVRQRDIDLCGSVRPRRDRAGDDVGLLIAILERRTDQLAVIGIDDAARLDCKLGEVRRAVVRPDDVVVVLDARR